MNLRREMVCENRMMRDWNGGCSGRGSPGVRYFRSSTGMTEIISRMLMNGRASDESQHYDMTLGWVYGIEKGADKVYRKENVAVGFKGDVGFLLPQCK